MLGCVFHLESSLSGLVSHPESLCFWVSCKNASQGRIFICKIKVIAAGMSDIRIIDMVDVYCVTADEIAVNIDENMIESVNIEVHFSALVERVNR